MHFIFSISAALFATTLVRSAPTGATLDAATLLANGQAAQKLNSQFSNGNISASDPCQGDQIACIENAIATCVNGKFDVSQGRCSKSNTCFALPNVRQNGTDLACTSEKSALSLIEATGAKGGITGSDAGSSEQTGSSRAASTTADSDDEGSEMSCTDTSVPTASPTVDRVTVTVTLAPTQTVTLPPITTTISPEEASSVLSSIAAQGTATLDDSASSSTILSTPSASAEVTDTASPAATTILLTVGRDASETTVPSSSTLASAAAAITSSADASTSDDGSYGSGAYGGY